MERQTKAKAVRFSYLFRGPCDGQSAAIWVFIEKAWPERFLILLIPIKARPGIKDRGRGPLDQHQLFG